MFNYLNQITMNSYISYDEVLKNGFEFLASKEDVENFIDDPIKKKVIEAIKDGSWVDKFCYQSHLEEYPVDEFSLESGFLFEDFYANETFVMFAKFSSLLDWKKFLDVRLRAHNKAANARKEYYDVMKRGNVTLYPLDVNYVHAYFSYYVLHTGVIEYLLDYGDIDKVKEFVFREDVKKSRELQAVVKGKFDNLFLKHLTLDGFGDFFDFWVKLVVEGCVKNPKLCRETEKIFIEKYPDEYAIYQKLFRESL